MFNTKHSQRWRFSALGACLLLSILARAGTAQVCTHLDRLDLYSQGDYTVRAVRVDSPIDFLHAISSQLNALKAKLPLQPGSVFTASKREEGRKLIEDALDAAEKDADPRSRIRVILAKIENCNETNPPRQLDVVYRIFTTNYNSYLSHTWELKSDEIERPATTAATSQAKGFLTLQPLVAYNRTRRLYGGGLLRVQAPGGILDGLELLGSGSPPGNQEDIELSGSRSPKKTALDHLEYRFGYRHSKLPADNNRLRTGLLQVQFFGVTRPLGNKGLVVRFGTSLEGGNQQTDLVNAASAAKSVASSGYGGLKTYLGATLRSKKFSLAGSYALQIGTRGATARIDFVKHIADLGLTAQWGLPKKSKPGEVHKAFTLEAQLTGGVIQTLGQVPVTQRFFGGNVPQNFIEGDSWRIRNGPVIRSIPQNRLNSSSAAGAIGGTSFYSVNLTVARPVWGYPIVPKEMTGDPEFDGKLIAAKESARKALVFAYLDKLPASAFAGIIEHMGKLDSDFVDLKNLLDSLPEELPASLPPEIRDTLEQQYEDAKDEVFSDWEGTNLILQDKPALRPKLLTVLKDEDVEGCKQDTDQCSKLTKTRMDLSALADILKKASLASASDTAQGISNSLAKKQTNLAKEYDAIDKSEAERLANVDMQLVEPILNSFLNEINWIAVSPVGVVDVARIWPDKSRTRFGIGGGLRVTLVNFNVTLGYAINPHRKPTEGRGAFFFSMDVTDLFR